MKWYYYCLTIIGLLMVNIIITSFKNNEVKHQYSSEQSRIMWAYDKDQPDFSNPYTRQRLKLKRINEDQIYHMKFEDGYFLQIQDDNTILLKDGDKIVHVFNRSYEPNRNLFYVIDRDNY